ncbi:MAG: multidrug ABC transporter ATP-binding protein [Myxococcales bacterium]
MIKVQDLRKAYGEVEALRGISFEVPEGQVVGFLGPNGAGKTTTMKILTCFMSATSGTVTVDGHDAFENPIEVRRRIGYLPESTPLYGDMVVYDYLNYVAEMRDIPKDQRRAAIARICQECGCDAFVGREIGTLSKGQKQRVGLAQAMIHDPPILILDEPTSGLDPNQIVEIRSLIKEIGRKRTIILSTHNLPEVMQTCDRLLIIHQGRIVADGTAADLEAREATNPRVLAQLGGVDGAAVAATVGALPGVRSVRERGKANGTVHIEVETAPGVDVRPDIYRAAVDNRWVIYDLHRDVLDLEGIFRRLTQSA